jgi:hypothetical protein
VATVPSSATATTAQRLRLDLQQGPVDDDGVDGLPIERGAGVGTARYPTGFAA